MSKESGNCEAISTPKTAIIHALYGYECSKGDTLNLLAYVIAGHDDIYRLVW